MDNHAFASLAHVRILLLPIGAIPHAMFEKYAAEIRSFEAIRLGDIPADPKGERGMPLHFNIHQTFRLTLHRLLSSIYAQSTVYWPLTP
jgi:hypothetical protein